MSLISVPLYRAIELKGFLYVQCTCISFFAVVQPGTNGWKKIRQHFGSDVFLPNGELNREKLGQVIFNDAEKRKVLNSITHPEIYKAIAWKVVKNFLLGKQGCSI